ncbi:hypothetical protein KSS87_014291, partial [Heliosperma pusillum]
IFYFLFSHPTQPPLPISINLCSRNRPDDYTIDVQSLSSKHTGGTAASHPVGWEPRPFPSFSRCGVMPDCWPGAGHPAD